MFKNSVFTLREGGQIGITKRPRENDEDFYGSLELSMLSPTTGTVGIVVLSHAEFSELTTHFRVLRGDHF